MVDTDLCPGGASVMRDTVIICGGGGVPPPSWGTQPCPREGCQSRRRGAALPWACLVSEERRPQPGTLIPCSPQHCLLGWDIIPPKSEKSSAPKTLDLWSSVSPEAHHQKLSATSCPHLVSPRCPGRGRHLGAAWGLQSLWGRDWGWGRAEPGNLSLWAPVSLALTPSTSPVSTAPHWLPHRALEADPNSEIQKEMRLHMGGTHPKEAPSDTFLFIP